MSNYDLYINDDYNKKTFKIYVAKNQQMINFMIIYFNDYIQLQNKKIIAIDLEFNKVSKSLRDVALIQLNLEIVDKNEGILFVLDPKILNSKELKVLKKLLTDPTIIKILHGGESLDIPYLLNQLLENDIDMIKNFLNNLYDTKYLCEYKHIEENQKRKCSIYDLYKEFNVINEKIYNDLNNIENIIGPIYLIHINIKKLAPKVLEYAVYDVLYLVSLYHKIVKISDYYNILIPNITQHIFFYKRIENIYFKKINDIVINYNNYYIVINNENIKLIDYYYYIIYSLDNKIYKEIINITYFKFFIEIIYKYIIYSYISDKYIIYKQKKNKSIKIKNNIDNKILFNTSTINFFNDFRNDIESLI